MAAAAATYDECVTLMREAVAFQLESLREHGETIPEPTAVGALTVRRGLIHRGM